MEAKKYNAVKKLITCANNGIDDEYVEKINDKEILKIKFQTGGTATTKKNGIFIEDLLIVAYAKLKESNDQLPCRENSIALTKIKRSSDFVPDWNNKKQEKWYVAYDYCDKCLYIDASCVVNRGVIVSYKTEEDAEQAIKDLEPEYLLHFGVEKGNQ